MKIYIDGSGFNGRESKYAVVFEDGKIIKEKFTEKRTNNEMEYEALIRALQFAEKGDIIYTDSQLVVGQVMKGWRITKEHLFPLAMKAKKLRNEKHIPIIWIPRKENLAGNILEDEK